MSNKTRIAGVSINLDSTDLKKLKSVTGLSKLGIFNHITDKDAKINAENELAVKLGIKEEEAEISEQTS